MYQIILGTKANANQETIREFPSCDHQNVMKDNITVVDKLHENQVSPCVESVCENSTVQIVHTDLPLTLISFHLRLHMLLSFCLSPSHP